MKLPRQVQAILPFGFNRRVLAHRCSSSDSMVSWVSLLPDVPVLTSLVSWMSLLTWCSNSDSMVPWVSLLTRCFDSDLWCPGSEPERETCTAESAAFHFPCFFRSTFSHETDQGMSVAVDQGTVAKHQTVESVGWERILLCPAK